MTSSKNTKRALLASVLSVVLCAAMLVGSTFAWFTDSVTSTGNIIKSGTLEVTMKWAKGTEDPASATWKDASEGAIFDYDLWEPGYTEVRHVKISNIGSLALKYEVRIAATGEVSELADVIDVYYIKNGAQITDRTQLNDSNKIGTLAQVLAKPYAAKGNLSGKKGETVDSDIATIALKMQEGAGNEYQGKFIGSEFAVVLVATQDTVENDSFGSDQYDKDAPLPEVIESTDYGSLQEAVNAADGDIVVVKENQSPASALNISKDITLNLGSSIINGDNNSGNGINISGDSKTVTIQATTGGVQLDNERCIRMSSNGSNITVDGGSYSLAGTHNAYLMEGSGDNNTVTIQNVTYNGERGFQLSNGDNNTILIKDSTFATTGYSAVYLGGNNNVLTLENVTITGGSRIMAADTFHSGDNAYATINITSGTYDCDLTTNDGCIISITGGRFSDDPTKYLAEGYKADYDRDARMWTVVAE